MNTDSTVLCGVQSTNRKNKLDVVSSLTVSLCAGRSEQPFCWKLKQCPSKINKIKKHQNNIPSSTKDTKIQGLLTPFYHSSDRRECTLSAETEREIYV